MIHIIDPKINPRVSARDMHYADLVAHRTKSGRYHIVKSVHFRPGRKVTRATLNRYIAEALEFRS